MSVEDQFKAAVAVIQGLPKNGPFQPSNEMMLKFYSYYKQATEGPCHISKPGFWDVVKRAKFDGWNKLGNMAKEEAMKLYVEELKKIVEVMSFDCDVATFTEVLGPFYEYMSQDEVDDEETNRNKDKALTKGIQSPSLKYQNEPLNHGPDQSYDHMINQALGKFDEGPDNGSDEDSLAIGMGELADDLELLQETIRSQRTDPKGEIHLSDVSNLPTQIAIHRNNCDDANASDNTDEEDVFHEAISDPKHMSQMVTNKSIPEPYIMCEVTNSLNHSVEMLRKDLENVQLRLIHLDEMVQIEQKSRSSSESLDEIEDEEEEAIEVSDEI
eukprot:TCALIF_04133-PA protein Name:"Similar to ACBD5 Acyl-CoA-binding domain-containing protein 5 (Bos taurus)" AED:0.12 eAED:0.12 QI:163/0.8/0.66/0.83/0.6/0.5/6/0/326